VQGGSFREDLYYRLNVMPINMPPLRERREDIPDLARFLVGKIAKSQGRELEIDDSGVGMLMRYDWPGNVRELENCLERAAVMSEAGLIDKQAINMTGLESSLQPGPAAVSSSSSAPRVDIDDPDLDERERVIAALEQAGWVQAKAARLLGMTPRQIGYRIQTLNIKVRQL
jgi:Nif-specific regulatory protein